jgi:hypothetical protein
LRKIVFLIAVLAGISTVWLRLDLDSGLQGLTGGGDALAQAFEQRATALPVQGRGVVTRVLPDDVDGNRHQRFILRLDSGQTLLVTHNIDLAPRIPRLREGDAVAFRGVYEWNSQGGVVHWTHHDPQGRRAAGWLQHNGTTYR